MPDRSYSVGSPSLQHLCKYRCVALGLSAVLRYLKYFDKKASNTIVIRITMLFTATVIVIADLGSTPTLAALSCSVFVYCALR